MYLFIFFISLGRTTFYKNCATITNLNFLVPPSLWPEDVDFRYFKSMSIVIIAHLLWQWTCIAYWISILWSMGSYNKEFSILKSKNCITNHFKMGFTLIFPFTKYKEAKKITQLVILGVVSSDPETFDEAGRLRDLVLEAKGKYYHSCIFKLVYIYFHFFSFLMYIIFYLFTHIFIFFS